MNKIRIFFTLLLTLAAAFISALGALAYTAHQAQQLPQTAEMALVLGNAVNRAGKPNPCLRSRVAAGVDLYQRGKVQTVLMSGGTDGDGSNEAATMRQIALQMGMPSEKILLEKRSENTYENIAFSAPLLTQARIVLVSDGFHLARARWLAARHWQDKDIQVFAAESCGDTPLNHARKYVREVLAWMKALLLHG